MPVPPTGTLRGSLSGGQYGNGTQFGDCPGVPGGITELKPYQIDFGASATGDFTNHQVLGVSSNGTNWKEMDGFDISNMRTSDVGRPRDQGEFVGYDFLSGRDITLKFDTGNYGSQTLSENLLKISTLFLPQNNIETPLYFNLPGLAGVQGIGTDYGEFKGAQNGNQGQLACMARPRNRSWKIDVAFSQGNLAQDMQAMLHATDPRFYSTPTLYQQSNSGAMTCTNAGNFDCRPRIILFGGAQGDAVVGDPKLTNSSLPGGPQFSWQGYSIPSAGNGGARWIIELDCFYQTITIQSPGAQTAVAAGSDGETIATGTIHVGSTDGFDVGYPNGGFFSQQPLGYLGVQCYDGSAYHTATISYTGTTSTSFTGCDIVSGNTAWVIHTGYSVEQNAFGPVPFTAALYPGSQWFSLWPDGWAAGSQYGDNVLAYDTSSGSSPVFGVTYSSAWIL